ncbi:MAG: fumarylacetoacetate hydrolase family protein [Brachymonas denitrificans]|uniref:fumarylacetoacetate hydrolase family protein n=1 Tax=Brachymonas denitrificans TaxID=28220 RepID=UPI00352FD005
MKLATYRDGSRDGLLVVVSRDLRHASFATHTASRLQQVLDDWNFISPQLEELYRQLNAGRVPHAFAFDPERCMAPLPRAFQRADGAVYAGHGAAAASATAALRLWQAGSDRLLGPHDPVTLPGTVMEPDFEAGLAAICGDLPAGASATQALEGVRLLLLCNGIRLRQLDGADADGTALLSRPAMAFGPVAITPDELGEAWRDGRAHLSLHVQGNGRKLGLLDTGADMQAGFDQLLERLCRTRAVSAGSLLAAGPVSNRDRRKGVACLADKRALEIQDHGSAETPWLQPGDTLRIEARSRDGQSVFGAIDQDFIAPGEQA